ncbi:uncharacterized protein LOC143319009 [Chaetodon auriga]|uniref:uncharacterized protein LOC143319009 n=1 Tax=Chaetodon auriga TaxID=39042 RepID=UPI004033142C
MGVSLKVIIYLMTARTSLLSVTGNNEGHDIATKARFHHSGDTVQIKCHYPDGHENDDKFLCKGENPFSCKELIHTTETNTYVTEGRFHIKDNKRLKYFYVLVKDVNPADSGTYWCGSGKMRQELHHKILLTVDERPIKSKTTKGVPTSTRQGKVPPNIGVIGGVVGCLVLLLILVVVFLLVRHKLPSRQVCCPARGSTQHGTNAGHNTEGNHGDHHYEDIHMCNQQASSGNTLPSVYATVNPPADQLHYASVNFQNDPASVSTDKNALSDANKNGSSACDYSSVSRTVAAEQTLYSAVTKPGEQC